MTRTASIVTLAIGSCLASFSPLLAAPPAPAVAATPAATPKPAEQCLGDVKAFGAGMSKGGYWLGGSDAGY